MNWLDYFRYSDGLLYWRWRPRDHFTSDVQWKGSNTRWEGRVAGSFALGVNGKPMCVHVSVSQRMYKNHRIIWEMFNGPIPEGMEIDHIDLDPFNNRLSNLRLATSSYNKCNRRVRKDSKSGMKGVIWVDRPHPWRASIRLHGKAFNLGYYPTKGLAAVAYAKAAIRYHGNFARI